MQLIDTLIEQLTVEQKKAVHAPPGEFIVKAGAGTGKTRVLIARYLKIYTEAVSGGLLPEDICSSILTVTFTKKAAKEMSDRLSEYIPMDILRYSNIMTIDAFCSRFLKDNSFAVGIDPDFTVLDEIESRLLFRKTGIDILENEVDCPVDFELTREVFLNEAYSLIGRLKHKLISVDEFASSTDDNRDIHLIISKLYKNYERHLMKDNLMDFGKLLFLTYNVLTEESPHNTRIKKNLQEKYKYVLVDEYQDTNSAQIDLLKLIAEPQNNYYVVGDEKQSIYGFRGAESSCIVESYRQLPEERKVFLKNNFRSPEPIPALVNSVFSKIVADYEPIESSVSGKADIELFLDNTRELEADFIARRIRKFLDSGYKHDEIVVLLRGVKNSRAYEEALKSAGIPTVTTGGSGFYHQPEIKDIIAILSIIDNAYRDKELVRMLRSPAFKVKNSELAELAETKGKGGYLYHAAKTSSNKKIQEAVGFIKYFSSIKNRLSLVEFINEVIEKSSLLYSAVSGPGGKHSRAMSNLIKFIEIARKFTKSNTFAALSDFTDYLNLLDEIDIAETEARPRAEGVVNIMSIHQAKGLEFPVVFVSNIAPLNFPSGRMTDKFHFLKSSGLVLKDDEKNSVFKRTIDPLLNDLHNQEERRLLYVAMTRSKKHLILTGFTNSKNKISRYMEYFLEKDTDGYLIRPELRGFIKRTAPLPEEESSPVCDYNTDKRTEKILRDTPEYLGLPSFPKRPDIRTEFSVTELDSYARCPMSYYFRYRLKLPESPRSDIFSPTLFGTAVHKTLELLFTDGLSGNTVSIKEKISEIILSTGVSSDSYKQHYRLYTEKISGNITASGILVSDYDAILTEKPFFLKIGDSYIKGTIDRIDTGMKGARLIDYKTSDKKPDISRCLLQMGIYKKAAEQVFSLKVTECAVYFAIKNKILKAPAQPYLDIKIKSILNGLKNHIYFPLPGHQCSYCPYSKLCGK
ncbi:MAG: ATP-dependent DNA helicase [Elusimicrobiota bacterium]